MTDAEGLTTTYTYDALGRVIAETKSGGGVRPDTTISTTRTAFCRARFRSAVALSLSAAVQDTFGRLQLNLKKTSDYFKRFIMYDSLCGAIYNQRMPPRR